MPLVVVGIDELKQRTGEHIGVSDWLEITPELVDAYGTAIGTHEWIHSELEQPDRTDGPIVPGFLTLSLLVRLWLDVLSVKGVAKSLNYGMNRLRFPQPVAIGSRIRLDLTLVGVKDVTGGADAMYEVVIELENSDKPACVAQCLFRYYRDEKAES